MSGESLDWLDEYWRQKREHSGLRRERTREIEASLNGHSRSDLVFQAARTEPNPYRLAHVAIKAARRFHVTTERMETTISDSLRRIGRDHASPPREKPALSRDAAGPKAA